MKIGSSAAGLALVLGLGVALAGCGKLNEVRAMKAIKDAHKLYQANDWRAAAEKYEEALQLNPAAGDMYFYLGNSYDNLYRPTRKGEPNNDCVSSRRPSTTTSSGPSGRRRRSSSSGRSSTWSTRTARRS